MSHLLIKHPVRVAKAVTTNLLAGLAPGWYSNWTGETGRGREPLSAEATAEYFAQCVRDYRQHLGLDECGWRDFLRDKVVMEYGPGDIPGVALLLVGQGARSVTCVDQFPLVRTSDFNNDVLDRLVQLLDGEEGVRAARARSDFLSSMGTAGSITYRVSPNGASGLQNAVDLILSRAVLEHVSDLDATYADMRRALKPDGLAIHQVDLKSHGMHIHNPLDFLVWPTWLWRLMYSRKGAPNRIRVNHYLDLAARYGFQVEHFESTGEADEAAWLEVRSELAAEFRALDRDEVCCLGFWMMLKPT